MVRSEHVPTPDGDGRSFDFDTAREMAATQDFPGYAEWRSMLERRYSVMPLWYWNESTCRQNYVSHIQSLSRWQDGQARINAGITAFHQDLGRNR